ncbi:MAG: ATP-binding protein, partial [Defluviitaleaceae bacterium]|nr:ATP-binding protein [Defluviitaleaceae bacterium]
MKVYIGSFLAKYNLFFGITDGGDVSATFRDELDNESSKLSYILFIALIIWLPYIPIDMELHKYPPLALALRLGFSLTALVMLAIKWTKAKKIRSSLIIIVTMSYLFLATALVTSTSGDMFQAYMGGFMLVIMIPVFAPVSLLFKILIPAASFALFFAVGITEGIDYSEPGIRYAMNDMTVSLFLSVLFSISQNNLRHSAWKQRQKLREMVESNDKNLATIFDLAKKAEASDRAKSEFLAMMSHEIRTPMNAIIGIAQIQLHNKNLQPEYASALEKIYNSGNSLLGIINDILDLSKIETGKLQLCPIEYSVPRMINDSVQINVVRIGQKPVEFVLEIDEDLPKRLIGDELRIKQILNNILSNAIKYTERGRVILTVKSQRKGDSVALRFTVEDTGQGIKDEDKGRLFLEYQRFNDEANRATEGTGLGLNITKRLVELMDGTVEMESKYGVGTVFTITVMQESAEIDTVGAEMARELNSFTYRGERALQKHDVPIESMPYGSVLVVDDVETNLYVAKGLLSPYKVFVDTAGSGFEAIEKTDGGRTYDIIFMDHMMPQMDGIEATQKLRQKGYKGAI